MVTKDEGDSCHHELSRVESSPCCLISPAIATAEERTARRRMEKTNQQTISFYLGSDEAKGVLRDALCGLDANDSPDVLRVGKKRDGSAAIGVRGSAKFSSDEVSSADEVDNPNSDESSSDGDDRSSLRLEPDMESTVTSSTSASHQKVDRRKKKSGHKKRGKDDIVRRMGMPPSVLVPTNDNKMALLIPTALMPHGNTDWDLGSVCKMCIELADNVSADDRTVVVLLLSSGRFAGAVFKGDKCVVHRVCTRYTVRGGQGGAQSSLDSSKGKAKSMGAQLRRSGEANLRQDVNSTLLTWQKHIDDSAIVLLSCPKTMRKGLHEDTEVRKHLPRDDDRIRKIPLDVGRPSFESACAVNEVLMRIAVRPMTDEEGLALKMASPSVQGEETVAKEPLLPAVGNSMKNYEQVEEKRQTTAPFTPIHEAAAANDLVELTRLLELRSDEDESLPVYDVDSRAGETDMTPLHVAASSSDPAKGAECVSALLLTGHANPCVVDGRNRPPYFVASHDKIRDAFRKARATLGEDQWSWEVGKVGPPLSLDDLGKRKTKAAEKKRRQRARQKEKKAKEKAEAERENQRLKEEEEKKKQEDDAKRIRAGLKPKSSTADNICDFCQMTCKRRSKMFTRLEYAYCSTDCVKRHQRELTAGAALSRLGG